jgi:hypothetical protein
VHLSQPTIRVKVSALSLAICVVLWDMFVDIFSRMVARESLHHLVELISLVSCTTQLLAQ